MFDNILYGSTENKSEAWLPNAPPPPQKNK